MKVNGEIDKHNQSRSTCFQAFFDISHIAAVQCPMGRAANNLVSIFGFKVSKGDMTGEQLVFLDFEEMDVTSCKSIVI